jgi:dipeptidyl-peptidase 9
MRSKLVEKVQLTHGNWEVSDKEVWVDETNNLVYFTGLKESPLERHLYVISLNYPKLQPKRLTVEDFSHTTIAFNSSFNYFIDIQSNITIPPFGYLQRTINSGNLPDAEPVSLFLGSSAHPGEDNDQIDLLPGMAAPQLFDYRLKSGDLINGFIFKPECMEAGVRYPVLLEIYGGPEVQLISKSFKGIVISNHSLNY